MSLPRRPIVLPRTFFDRDDIKYIVFDLPKTLNLSDDLFRYCFYHYINDYDFDVLKKYILTFPLTINEVLNLSKEKIASLQHIKTQTREFCLTYFTNDNKSLHLKAWRDYMFKIYKPEITVELDKVRMEYFIGCYIRKRDSYRMNADGTLDKEIHSQSTDQRIFESFNNITYIFVNGTDRQNVYAELFQQSIAGNGPDLAELKQVIEFNERYTIP